MKIKGSVALITGGCQGFGKAFSIELLKRGGKVSVIDVNETVGKNFVEQCQAEFGEENVTFVHCDVTDSSSFEDAFNKTKVKFGKIDLVSNNAGSLFPNWRKTVDLNLSSVIQGTNLAIQHMSPENGGNGGLIINTGSAAGINPFMVDSVYTATKFGVVGFSQSSKGKFTEQKIRVNCLCPTFSLTGFLEKAMKDIPGLKSVVDEFGHVPIEDVAKGFLELVNDDSRDGEILVVYPEGLFYVKTTNELIPVQPSSN